MTLTVDIKPSRVESAIVRAAFDTASAELEQNRYEIIALPQNAELRIQQGQNSNISQNGNYVKEGLIYTPNGKPRLVRNSPILYSAKEATQAHREGREFYPTQEKIENALADSVDFPSQNIEIPTNRFGSEELTVYAIGGGNSQAAQLYGDFLKEAGIKKMPIWAVDKSHVDKQEKPFARQLWFGGLDGGGRSYLGGDDWVLGYGDAVRGVHSV